MRKAVRWLGRLACVLVSFLGTVQSTPLSAPAPASCWEMRRFAAASSTRYAVERPGATWTVSLANCQSPGAVQAPFGEAPDGGVTCFNTKVLEVCDHGCDWPFDKFGRRLQLGSGLFGSKITKETDHCSGKDPLSSASRMIEARR